MPLTPIDYEQWDRREIFEAFRTTCMYTTVQLDIATFLAKLDGSGLRFYPSVIYCIAKVVNSSRYFRYGYDADGHVGLWDVLHPMYTVPRVDKPDLFSIAVTPYNDDFTAFYQAFTADYAKAEACGQLFSAGEPPKNTVGVTAMPGTRFSAFAFGDAESKPDLTPFTVLGRYQQTGNRVLLPVCTEFAHGVNDGYHISLFFEKLEQTMQSFLDFPPTFFH